MPQSYYPPSVTLPVQSWRSDFPLPSDRRHDQKSGNESSGQDFRSMRPSLAVNYTAHVADSQRFLLQGPLFSKEALAQIAKSGGLRFRSELPAVLASGAARGGRQCWRFLTRTRLRYAQPHRHRIPNTAEQSFKRSGRDYARSCKKSRNPRRALERKSTGSANWKSSHHQSFQRLSVGTSVTIEPLWTAQTARPDMDEQCHR